MEDGGKVPNYSDLITKNDTSLRQYQEKDHESFSGINNCKKKVIMESKCIIKVWIKW